MVSVTTPARWPRWARYVVLALVAVTLLAATGVVGYRVLAPAETAVPASQPYPERPALEPARYGELTSAPLIVDGRLRVFADARRVWADAHLTGGTEMTPFWTFRRWPAEVAGVVAVEGKFEGAAMVIAKFSDGVVVGIDPKTGRVAWQDRAGVGVGDRYLGRRTGALTVYQPAGLFTARSNVTGATVLIVSGGDQAIGYDPWNGQRRWEQSFTEHPGCHDTDWTGETTYVVKDSCAVPAVLRIYDAGTGGLVTRWQPVGASAGSAEAANWYAVPASCVRGHSGCALVKASPLPETEVLTFEKKFAQFNGVTPDVWRVNHDGTLTAEPKARSDRPFLLGETLVLEEAGAYHYIQAVERSTGTSLWRSKEPVAQLAAVGHLGVYAVTTDFHLIVLHPTNGVELSRTDLRKNPSERWVPGHVHVADRFVAVERITGGSPRESDERYFVGPTPVVVAGV